MRRLPATLALAVAVVVGTGAPAYAGNDPVTVTVQCVWANADGTTTAVWDYDNTTSQAIDVPIGPDNRFTTAPDDRGQPTHFLPGLHQGAWLLTYGGPSAAWHLLTSGDTANPGSPACATNPVPVLGSWGAGAIGLAVALPIVAFILARSRRLRALFGVPSLPGLRR